MRRLFLLLMLAILAATLLTGCGTAAQANPITGSYTNAYDGYTLAVPVGWRVEPASAPGATAILYSYPEEGTLEPGRPATKIDVYVEPLPGPMSLQDALALRPLDPEVKVVREILVEVDGRPARQQDLKTPGGTSRTLSLVYDARLLTLVAYGDLEPAGAIFASLMLK